MSDDRICKDEKMRSYFERLPPFVQESIRQSGLDFDTPEELKQCAENLLKSK